MRDTAANSLSCIVKNNIFCLRVIGKFSLYDDAKPAKLKKNVRSMFAMNVNCLCIGSYAEPRN